MDQTAFRRMKYAEDPVPEAPSPPYLAGFQDIVHGSPERQHHVQRLMEQYAKDKKERELGREGGKALGVVSGVPLVAGGALLGTGGGAALADSLTRGHREALNQWEKALQGLKHNTPCIPDKEEIFKSTNLLPRMKNLLAENPELSEGFEGLMRHLREQPQLSQMRDLAVRALPVAGALGGLALGGYGAYRGYKALRDWGERRKGEQARSDDPALNASVDILRERAKAAALAKYAGIR